MTTYTWQQFLVGCILLATAALEAVWVTLLNDFDKLDKSGLSYTSTRNLVLVATILLGNIIFMSFLKTVTHTHTTQGPFYAGLLASQALISSALVTVAFWDAWSNDASYEQYYGKLTFGVLQSTRWQLTSFVASWACTGFVMALAFDRRINEDKNQEAAQYAEAKRRQVPAPTRARAPASVYYGDQPQFYVPQAAPLGRVVRYYE